jgi:hypothetical protein
MPGPTFIGPGPENALPTLEPEPESELNDAFEFARTPVVFPKFGSVCAPVAKLKMALVSTCVNWLVLNALYASRRNSYPVRPEAKCLKSTMSKLANPMAINSSPSELPW